MKTVEVVQEVENMPAPVVPVKRTSGLAGKDFSHLFRADRDPRRVEFTAGGEKPCYVALLPLDKDHRNTLMRMSGGVIAADGAPDVLDFIVGNTVVDFVLWHRPEVKAPPAPNSGGAVSRAPWQMIKPAAGSRSGQAILNQIKSDFHALPEFWDALVFECLAENGFGTSDVDNEASEGND